MVESDVERLKRLRECAEPFGAVFQHGVGAMREGLLAARSFIDAWITLVDRVSAACDTSKDTDESQTQKVEIQ